MWLDVACGFGYRPRFCTALWFVVAVEDDENRAQEAQGILSEQGIDNAAVMTAPLADCRQVWPYDVIIVQGGVEQVPAALTDQLREGGRIVAVFHEGSLGIVRIGHKLDGTVNWRFALTQARLFLPDLKNHAHLRFD